jgi:hypothetical protein
MMFHTFKSCFGFWVCLLGCCAAVDASPVLRCHFEVNAERVEHSFLPVSEPYEVPSVNLANRFRFKAVVLGDQTRVDLINLYVSYQTQRQPMLLQHVKFVAPVAQTHPMPESLTGRVALYSPFLGKELLYSCALHEVQP